MNIVMILIIKSVVPYFMIVRYDGDDPVCIARPKILSWDELVVRLVCETQRSKDDVAFFNVHPFVLAMKQTMKLGSSGPGRTMIRRTRTCGWSKRGCMFYEVSGLALGASLDWILIYVSSSRLQWYGDTTGGIQQNYEKFHINYPNVIDLPFTSSCDPFSCLERSLCCLLAFRHFLLLPSGLPRYSTRQPLRPS